MLLFQDNDEVCLLKVTPRNTFYDKKAYTTPGGKIGTKFKIFIKKAPQEVGSFLFFPTTTREWRLKKSSAVEVFPGIYWFDSNTYPERLPVGESILFFHESHIPDQYSDQKW